MSVNTTADEALSKAKEHLKDAIEQLYIFNNPTTWGNDVYTIKFKNKISKFIIRLEKFRSR